MTSNEQSELIIYTGDDGKPRVQVRLQDENMWLTQAQLVDIFQSSKSNISEHISNIFADNELQEDSVVRELRTTATDGKTYNVKHYNLDVLIALGYRVKSQVATNFRIWATERLREYMTKGFVMNDEALKQAGGGDYWHELLERIRDIRSSEKMMYRQVLELFATSQDYATNTAQQQQFFAIMQNKLHYAVCMLTAAEVVHSRVDSDKDFLGLTNFKGKYPTKDEAKIAKNYLSKDELATLNRLVSAFFDLAELKAINHESMYMRDWIIEVDKFASAYGKGVLEGGGKVSQNAMITKVTKEYEAYKKRVKNELSEIEVLYLEDLKRVQKKLSKK